MKAKKCKALGCNRKTRTPFCWQHADMDRGIKFGSKRHKNAIKKADIHAMCVCMAARLTDCAKVLEEQAHLYRMTDCFEDAQLMSDTASAARKIISEWEAL